MNRTEQMIKVQQEGLELFKKKIKTMVMHLQNMVLLAYSCALKIKYRDRCRLQKTVLI